MCINTERPKPVVKVTPDQRVFRGETVTLTCDIQGGGNIQWTYSWFKDGSVIRRVTERVYSITSDQSDSGEYRCRGERSDSQRSDTSAAVTLTVSDLSRSTLTVTPDSPVFTGDTVNLTCVIESDNNWRYEWYKGSYRVMPHRSERYTVNRDTLSIRGATESDQDQYMCRGQRDERPKSSHSSSLVYLTVMDFPTSTLTVTPNSPVFTGETVNLKCEIESYNNWKWRNDKTYGWTYDWTPDWRYELYKGTDSVMLQTSEHYTVNRDTLTIRGATETDQDQYWCRGQRDERPKSSLSSSAVSLTVMGLKPKPEFTSDPAGAALTGNTVTLTCRMDLSTGWDFYWYKHTLNSEIKTETNSYRVKIDSVSDGGQYWCRAGRGKPVYYTQYSDALWVNVTVSPKAVVTVWPDERVFRGETVTLRCDIKLGFISVSGVSPSVSLVVSPSRSQHFSSDSLSLSCEDQSNSTGWTVRRYTDRNTEDCSKLTGSTCRIDSLNTSDAGVYWCQSESGEKRHPLNITVHDGDVILLSSVDPVIEGDTLTLHCLHRSTNSSILRADFYKDGSLVKNQTTGEMNITTVSKSHEGLYYCKTERGQSLHSWISVRVSGSGQISVFSILSSLLAACPYLLATVVLLFKCYRARESQDAGVSG
ncbi:sialoadhesin-like [Sinocyclocheilus grahami]|uniref:sialoadhesin-like n=1 Tax=Sinocyclocheilus grahami TaxID=75366 RepID=UPI0007ACD00E|nr:PREDICTED: sialoadhesin-like [Sinocyclocheilus grahami]